MFGVSGSVFKRYDLPVFAVRSMGRRTVWRFMVSVRQEKVLEYWIGLAQEIEGVVFTGFRVENLALAYHRVSGDFTTRLDSRWKFDFADGNEVHLLYQAQKALWYAQRSGLYDYTLGF